MDCRWALEILDSARPDSADWQESELEEAAAHVDSCPTCEETFRARQALDRRVGAVMRDVPVPADLLGRLTASLSAPVGQPVEEKSAVETRLPDGMEIDPSNAVVPQRAATRQPQQLPNRRRWMRTIAGSVAACALVLGAWLIFRPPAPTLTAEKIKDSVPLQLGSLDEFDNNFDAYPPLGWESEALQFSRTIKGFGRNRHDADQMALVEFQFQGRDGLPQSGLLAIVPRRDVVAADEFPTSFLSAIGSPLYREGGYTAFRWATEDLVYVCFVPDEGNALNRLEELLRREAA